MKRKVKTSSRKPQDYWREQRKKAKRIREKALAVLKKKSLH